MEAETKDNIFTAEYISAFSHLYFKQLRVNVLDESVLKDK